MVLGLGMKKRDGYLLVFFLITAAAMAVFMNVFGKDAGECVVVTVDGEEFGVYRLSQDSVIEVENAFGSNRIVIKNGSAYMEAADCPDKYCMTYQPVTKANESIICLPHRLVVQVEGKNYMETDGIAR